MCEGVGKVERSLAPGVSYREDGGSLNHGMFFDKRFTDSLQSTASGSALKTIRETELYGGVLSAALSREHLFLTADFLRGDECVHAVFAIVACC
jgi:hypothetical protein